MQITRKNGKLVSYHEDRLDNPTDLRAAQEERYRTQGTVLAALIVGVVSLI